VKRIANGFYTEQLSQPGHYLAIYQIARHGWCFAYVTWYTTPDPDKRATLTARRPAYPTRAMAISAAKGNRAS
jgi:hypothetical protein